MWNKKILGLVGPVTLLFGWWMLGMKDLIDPIFLPDLQDVTWALWQLLTHEGLMAAWATTSRSILSFVIGLLLAVPTGVLLALRPTLFFMTSGLIDFLRSIPAVALFPLFLLIFGIGAEAKVAVGTFVVFWVLLIQTVYAIWHIPPVRKYVGIVMHMSTWNRLIYLFIPQTLPEMMTGCRIALSLSLILIVVSEMLMASSGGMGALLLNRYLMFQTEELYAAIFLIGCIGYGLNKLVALIEKKTIHWAGR